MKIATLLKGMASISVVLIVTILSCIYMLDHSYNQEITTVSRQAEFKQLGIDLANASDYLTNEARRYTIQGDKEHYDNFWREVNETKTRDRVVRKLTEMNAPDDELALIDLAKQRSDDLIVIEEEAMEAVANKDFAKAQSLMYGTDYDHYKSLIKQPITEFQQKMNGRAAAETKAARDKTTFYLYGITILIVTTMVLLLVALLLIFNKFRPLAVIAARLQELARNEADVTVRLEVKTKDEIGQVAGAFNTLLDSLQNQAWVKSNLAEMTANLSGIQEIQPFAQTVLSKVVPLVEGCQAAFFVKQVKQHNDEPAYQLLASYAYKVSNYPTNTVRLGEGLVGQAAFENTPIHLANVPQDHIQISSGLGESTPLNIFVLPVSFEGNVIGVIELASFNPFNGVQQAFLEKLMSNLGVLLDSVIGRMRLSELLQESQTLTEELQAQSEELQAQQEGLRATNEELEEQTQALKQSEGKMQEQQEQLQQANKELEEKAMELTQSSKYKSEFLANMSHELRTPLNSLLILSKLLSDNKDGNLSDKQVQFANTIYTSGCDLLTLINDILDLAKVESGKMNVNARKIRVKDLVDTLEQTFKPVAAQKNVRFNTTYSANLPDYMYSDEQKLQQVLKNLLSNAFKFTQHGEVKLEIGVDSKRGSSPMISFSVIDTGIGIPENKQELIFHAFQQADGTTSRKYGGTGLGLSISRELSLLLGGEIVVESVDGVGSKFTFYVGDFQQIENHVEETEEIVVSREKLIRNKEMNINRNEPILSSKLISNIKRLLIVDDDLDQRNSLMEFIGEKNVIIKAVSTGAEAMEEIKVHEFDFIVLDLGLSDTTGFDLLERIKSNPLNKNVKIIIYTGRALTPKEEITLKKSAHTIIIKDSHSPERLMAELELYLNGSDDVTLAELEVAADIHYGEDLKGKKVLLVDDDVRNVFAISNVLEPFGMQITFAENGIEALECLHEQPGYFDIVLTDIMMPEMDGYETIKRIREMEHYKEIPIIALTAKAMKEDREKCLDVGSSDYIMKPVDPNQLVSLIKVWVFGENNTVATGGYDE